MTSCSEEAQVQKPKENNSKTILAIGDSLTIGLGLPESDSYPAQLEKWLQAWGYNYTVQNAGISWDTTAGLLSRIDWMLDSDTPSLAILCIGANDAFQWKNIEDIEKNLRAIIEKLQSKNIPILLAWMKAPLNLWTSYREGYDSLFPKIAQEYKLTFLPFLLEWVALDPKLNQDDRIHPTREWYTIVTSNLLQKIEESKLLQKD